MKITFLVASMKQANKEVLFIICATLLMNEIAFVFVTESRSVIEGLPSVFLAPLISSQILDVCCY